jgi:iron(III) transport system ATP-binding protein
MGSDQVELREVVRSYGEVHVVKGISATIRKGEFVSFLGPSGCGKTTTLRMVAGLDQATGGEILLEGRPVNAPARGIFVPPEERRLGMVFQAYALWPHMSVGANVAYPLVVRGSARPEADQRALQALEMVRLAGLAQRMPHELSGGQQQRVALARALAMEPAVLLLDEPLSNLDATLREQMRFEIQEIQRRLGITVIFVTHDQGEAFAMSDRIMVMHQGKIAQMGPPEELYREPADPFVAGFLGIANKAAGKLEQGGRVLLDGFAEPVRITARSTSPAGSSVEIAVRAESVDLADAGAGEVPAVVERATFLGDRIDNPLSVGGGSWRVTALPPARYAPGAKVSLKVRDAIAFATSRP